MASDSNNQNKGLSANSDPSVTANLSLIRAEGFSSPFPSANELKQLDEVVPGGAERVLSMIENQSNHRMVIEKAAIFGDTTRANFGLLAGFIVTIAFLAASVVLILNGHDFAGGLIGLYEVLCG